MLDKENIIKMRIIENLNFTLEINNYKLRDRIIILMLRHKNTIKKIPIIGNLSKKIYYKFVKR